MPERTNLYAFTEQPQAGAHYPGYVSLNREPDGSTTLTVRSPGHGGTQVGTITLPADVQTKLGAALKRDRLALWGNLVIAHTWGVTCWIRPGWFPAAVLLVAITLAALILYEDKITAAIAVRANDEHA